MVNQYCAHSFARNWQLPFLNQQKGENERRKYFMINLQKRMLPTSAGDEPATSWSPAGCASNWATEAGTKKKSRSTQGHHFSKLYWVHVLNAAYQAPESLAFWFQKRRILKGFYHICTMYVHVSHLGYVTQMWQTNFWSPGLYRLHMKFSFDWLRGFWGDVWRVWTMESGYTISSPVRWVKNRIESVLLLVRM